MKLLLATQLTSSAMSAGIISFFDICAQIVLIDVGLVGNEIDNSAQFTFSTNRKLNGGSIGLQAINLI